MVKIPASRIFLMSADPMPLSASRSMSLGGIREGQEGSGARAQLHWRMYPFEVRCSLELVFPLLLDVSGGGRGLRGLGGSFCGLVRELRGGGIGTRVLGRGE